MPAACLLIPGQDDPTNQTQVGQHQATNISVWQGGANVTKTVVPC